ncbi:MAG TPA: cation diffusion facilitator family transporter [Gemmatimonadaceae bacterium]|nr:cation diffusion facilitator family transporter [Gemmatimonadaceae bacterium]
MSPHAHAGPHAHDHAHGHGHAGHAHGAHDLASFADDPRGGDHLRRLRIALGITLAILVAEVVGGVLSRSLALIADAGHVLTDAAALALSLFVLWFARRAHPPHRTFGYWRLEILAAFLNGATLLLLCAWIIWEAVRRLRQPEPIEAGLMFGVAMAGMAANMIAAWILHPASTANLNIRGAYLHVIGDLLGSLATVVAAVLILLTGWLPADPIASLAVTLLVMRSAWQLVRESVDVLLETTPAHISLGAVRQQLEAIPGIESVHDLHVWTVTSGVVAMSAHAIVREPERHQHVLEHVHDALRLFGIQHVTVQLERREMYDREEHLHP